MDERYRLRREEFEADFRSMSPVEDSRQSELSPSGSFCLETSEYSGASGWNCSRGRVVRLSDGAVLADIHRNHPHFWRAWVQHTNGSEYLLCGEDYQGYTVVNLSKGTSQTWFSDEGYKGAGFCWTMAFASPDSQVLAVDGCYWACPYEIVLFDFRDPEALPYAELVRGPDAVSGDSNWVDNRTFAYRREAAFRKRDQAPYDSLPPEEQAEIDARREEVEYRTLTVQLPRPDLPPA